MFSKSKRRRRSEMRLGVQSIEYSTVSAPLPVISLSPLLKLWRIRGAKLTGVMVLAGLVWGVYGLFTSAMFFVYNAKIEGNVAMSSREIYAASGIDSQSIFWISAAAVTERIENLPNIKSAAVSVSLPATVVIKVEERQPELLWQTGESLWWVDQEGTIVPTQASVEGMMRIIDDDRQPVEAGYKLDPTIIRGAQTLRMLAPDLAVVRYSRMNGLTVATPEGWPVYLGNGSEVKAKLVVLTALLADLKQRNVTPAFIDVRNPLRPVYQPKSLIRIAPPKSGPAPVERESLNQ